MMHFYVGEFERTLEGELEKHHGHYYVQQDNILSPQQVAEMQSDGHEYTVLMFFKEVDGVAVQDWLENKLNIQDTRSRHNGKPLLEMIAEGTIPLKYVAGRVHYSPRI